MNELEHSYRRTVQELEGAGCAAALVGGIAASIRAKVRFTRNVDLARIGHLIALKLLSRSERRMQDQVDLVELIKVADEGEIGLAFAAAALIEARGFARGRRLGEDLRELLVVLRR